MQVCVRGVILWTDVIYNTGCSESVLKRYELGLTYCWMRIYVEEFYAGTKEYIGGKLVIHGIVYQTFWDTEWNHADQDRTRESTEDLIK